MREYLLSVDNGGTYIKAALFDSHGGQVAMAKRRNDVINLADGRAEFDQEALWDKNCACISEVIRQAQIDPDNIACVGFSGQGKGLYAVDKYGKSFRNAITSADARADKYCKIWRSDGTAQRLFPKLYQSPVAGQTVPILRWMKDNEPENYEAIRWVFSMKDYLFFRLTGKAIAGKGSQSGTCLVNLITQEYDDTLLEAFGIEEVKDKLPPLVWDTQLCATVSREAAAVTGLMEGTPVSAGMFDVDASALAMGVVDPDPIFMITGTCSINGYISPTPVTNQTIMFNSLYSLEGMYLIEEGSTTSAGVLEWVIDAIFPHDGQVRPYDEISRMVESVDPASEKLVFLPYLHGFRHGGKEGSFDSRAAWIGLCPEYTKADMLCAVYEGVVFSHMMHLDHLLKNRALPKEILMSGGATNTIQWVRMFADAMQIPVRIVEHSEMGAMGVAIASSVAVGMYPDIKQAVAGMTQKGRSIQPRKEYAEIYREKFARFKAVTREMEKVWPLYTK